MQYQHEAGPWKVRHHGEKSHRDFCGESTRKTDGGTECIFKCTVTGLCLSVTKEPLNRYDNFVALLLPFLCFGGERIGLTAFDSPLLSSFSSFSLLAKPSKGDTNTGVPSSSSGSSTYLLP